MIGLATGILDKLLVYTIQYIYRTCIDQSN